MVTCSINRHGRTVHQNFMQVLTSQSCKTDLHVVPLT
ncbi:unnamed protein product, partial [Amoebophrya sp. A120]|eukprot:GSA120T00021223001.1